MCATAARSPTRPASSRSARATYAWPPEAAASGLPLRCSRRTGLTGPDRTSTTSSSSATPAGAARTAACLATAGTAPSPSRPSRGAGDRQRNQARSTCCRWPSPRRTGRPTWPSCRATRSLRSTSSTPTRMASPGWACGGTPFLPSARCRWRSAACATRRRPSAAGTSAPRSGPATSPTPTGTTCCPRWRPCSGSTRCAIPPCGATAHSWR